jgi:hypothetical protein
MGGPGLACSCLIQGGISKLNQILILKTIKSTKYFWRDPPSVIQRRTAITDPHPPGPTHMQTHRHMQWPLKPHKTDDRRPSCYSNPSLFLLQPFIQQATSTFILFFFSSFFFKYIYNLFFYLYYSILFIIIYLYNTDTWLLAEWLAREGGGALIGWHMRSPFHSFSAIWLN